MPILHAGGADLHYLKEGRGPAVLLMQGVGVIGEAWRPQIDALADRFTLIAPDNRGVGGSRINDGALSIATMAHDAIAIIDAEHLDRVHLVGHSMGGAIAQAVALAARPRVRTLTLTCSFARGRDALSYSSSFLWLALRTRIGTRRSCRDAYLDLVTSRAFLDRVGRDEAAAQIARLFGHEINHQPPIVIRQLGAVIRHDARRQLPDLAGLPVLVIAAGSDRIVRAGCGRALAAAIPGARYVELDNAGHALPIERAADVTSLLRDHFDQAGSA